MRFTTNLITVLCLTSMSPSYGQFFKNITLPPVFEQIIKDLTFEVGINRSKVYNTKTINSFEAERKGRTYIVNIKKEHYPITTNYNMSIGYCISKKHHLRIRKAKNTLGSKLIGDFELSEPSGQSFQDFLGSRYTLINSTSIGLMYEYHSSYYEGYFVFGAGVERQNNQGTQETFLLPGIEPRSYSFHTHLGYLSELNQFIQLHGKVFTTYYFANNRQIYDSPIKSNYIPIQVGFEIALRVNLYNGFHHPYQNEKRRKKRNMYFIKPY